MSNVLASDLVRRKKEYVFAEGYFIDCANELTGGVDATQEVIHVYGQDDPILDINVDNATLSLTAYDKKDNNVLLDVLQQIDKNDTETKMYNWNNVYSTTVWANRINKDGDEYTRSIIYKNWLPNPGMTAGDANTKGTRTFAGNAEPPEEYTKPIYGEKVALTSGAGGYTGTITYTPLAIPGTSTFYAVRVVGIVEARTGNHITSYDEEDLTITAAMVTNAKAVVIATSDLNTIDGPSHAYVNYLYTATEGVYPTIAPTGKFVSV